MKTFDALWVVVCITLPTHNDGPKFRTKLRPPQQERRCTESWLFLAKAKAHEKH